MPRICKLLSLSSLHRAWQRDHWTMGAGVLIRSSIHPGFDVSGEVEGRLSVLYVVLKH
jgi:hypothetical protein